jgi:hypothetical protein
MNRWNVASATLLVLLAGGHADACELVDMPSAVDLVRRANLIVIARAMSQRA